MAEAQKRSIDKRESAKIQLALTLDMFVNGEDRLAGYVVLTGESVGKLTVDDINRYLKSGQLKAIEG
jgi:hypothetical protein